MNSECVKSTPAAFAVAGPAAVGAAGSASSADAPPRFERQGLALAVLFVGAFLAPLDYFIVNLALPAIHTGLGATDAQLQLIVSAYASAYAVLLITGGRLGDLYGRRRMFMTGMAGFVVASALCGLAPSGQVLVIARIVQAGCLLTMLILGSYMVVNFRRDIRNGRPVISKAAHS